MKKWLLLALASSGCNSLSGIEEYQVSDQVVQAQDSGIFDLDVFLEESASDAGVDSLPEILSDTYETLPDALPDTLPDILPDVTVSHTRTWLESMSAGIDPVGPTCISWEAFRASLEKDFVYTKVSIFGTLDPVGASCSGLVANDLCQALRVSGIVPITKCSGMNWTVDSCSTGISPPVMEIAASIGYGACNCVPYAFSVRPCIRNGNWGSAGGLDSSTCSKTAQKITVRCE